MKRFRLHILLIFLLGMILPALPGRAQDTRRQENRKARLQKEIRQINDALKDNKSKSRSEMTHLSLLKKQMSARSALIAENDAEIALISDSIRTTSGEITVLRQRLDTLEAFYNRLVRTAYKNRDSRVWYMYILGSRNLQQGVRRFSYLKNMSRELNKTAAEVKLTTRQLEDRKVRLDSLSEGARKRRSENQTEMSSLQKERSQSEQLIKALQKDKKKYTAQLQKKNREVEALNREIAAIIRKASEKAAAQSSPKTGGTASAAASGTKKPAATPSGKTVSTDPDPKLSGAFATNKGRLPWPVDGAVLESFGQHYHPVYKNIKLPYNNGVTVSTKAGAPVKAVYDGEVTQIIVMPGYNQCILVQHGKYFTFYCCLTGATVKRGDKVTTGQTLGTVCAIDGESKMHFELWQDRTPQNPENWLK